MTQHAKPEVIVAFPVAGAALEALRAHYTVHHVPVVAERQVAVDQLGARIVAVITNGTYGWDAALMRQMPKLKVIAAFGAGYENIDAQAAYELGIATSHGRGTNTISVADHALTLLFAIVRDVVMSAEGLQKGKWHTIRHARPDISGRRLGIFGLGLIGQAIATRARAFDMSIAYCNRKPNPDVAYEYVPSLESLAERVDFLICAAPGGAATQHVVNAAVLRALGPQGYLVNVGRGSVVDSDALSFALRNGQIAGAGLDVFEGEPQLPESLKGLSNLIVTPHIAGFSPDSFVGYIRSVVENVDACLAGRPAVTPIPL
jgi:lactate dehydrogenase-like 2-hydroxyacid dehydrogenase